MNVYDFDHTIHSGDSSVDFYCFILLRKPYLIILLPFQSLGMILYLFGIFSKERMKEYFFVFIRYIPLLEQMVDNFWKQNSKKIKSWYLQQKQDSDIIISASPEFLLKPLVNGHLRVSLIASQIDQATGKYCGKNCYGEEKACRFEINYPNTKIDNFYSDSLSDSPLAQMAKNAFLVNKKTIIKWKEE